MHSKLSFPWSLPQLLTFAAVTVCSVGCDHGEDTGPNDAPADVPAECTPASYTEQRLTASLTLDVAEGFYLDLDATPADGSWTCGLAVAGDAETMDPPVTSLMFHDSSGWLVILFIEMGAGEVTDAMKGIVSVSRPDRTLLAGGSECTLHITINELVADDVRHMVGTAECTDDDYGDVIGTMSFSILVEEWDGYSPSLCCEVVEPVAM